MYNRRYDKAFVMLKQELGGFSLGQQSAWGSCVMELKNKKGRFTFTVQGMKKLTDGRRYEAFVVGGKGNAMRGISCGVIEIDQHGKGELKWEFDPEKIGISGFHVEELHTAALIVKGGYGLIVPLVGYFNEKVAWKKLFQEEQDLIAAEAMLLEVPEKKLEKKAEKQQNNNVEPEQPKRVENIVEEHSTQNAVKLKPESSPFQKNFKNMLFQFKRELEKLEEKGILTEEDKKRIQYNKTTESIEKNQENQESQKVEETQKQKTETIETTEKIITEMPETQTTEIQKVESNKEIEYILQNNDDMQPFGEEIWKKIALEELAVLPVNFTEMMRNLFFIFAYRKYKHFIFQKIGEKEYVMGVPAQYYPENRKEAESLYFETFQPCGKETMKTGCYGYWLIKMKEVEV